jgi:cyclopropane fatty-acyl-phospholipid synthase-like methyltransferase
MRWNTPLSESHAARLLDLLDLRSPGSILDLGCGWGELLLRAVQRSPEHTVGVGVDSDDAALERGRGLARARGFDRRVEFVHSDAADYTMAADRVICIGSSLALGGTATALSALALRVRAGGRLLFGDGCWEQPPSAPAAEIFGQEVLALTAILGHACDAGWRMLSSTTADQEEWDEFEDSWRAGREQWVAEHRADPRAQRIADELRARREEYERVYRGVLGFCYLVLARED